MNDAVVLYRCEQCGSILSEEEYLGQQKYGEAWCYCLTDGKWVKGTWRPDGLITQYITADKWCAQHTCTYTNFMTSEGSIPIIPPAHVIAGRWYRAEIVNGQAVVYEVED